MLLSIPIKQSNEIIYIITEDKIDIEVQQNRDKLSPFIRNKKQIDNLEKQLSIEADKKIYQFIKLLNQHTLHILLRKNLFLKS